MSQAEPATSRTTLSLLPHPERRRSIRVGTVAVPEGERDQNVPVHSASRSRADTRRRHRLWDHWRGGDYGWGEPERKFKFRSADGCEVERKWKKGEYEEKVKCKPSRDSHGY